MSTTAICDADHCGNYLHIPTGERSPRRFLVDAGWRTVLVNPAMPAHVYCPLHVDDTTLADASQDARAMEIFLKSRTAEGSMTQWDVYLDTYRMLRKRIDEGMYD